MKTNIFISGAIFLGAACMSYTSCHSAHEHGDAEKASEETGHEGEIVMSREASRLAGVGTETAEASEFREVIKTGGRIEAPSGARATVTARASGVVSFADSRLAVGVPVKAGAALFTVSSRGMEQADGKRAATAALELAAKDLARAEELVKENLIPRKEYEKIKSDYAVAKADAEGVAVKGAAGSVAASSPVAGYVTSILVTQGQFVNQGDPLATVSQTRRMHLRADVSERQWARLGVVTGARVIVPALGEEAVDLSEYGFRLVSSTMPDVSASHYIPVYIEFDNPGMFRNGSVAEVYLLGAARTGVVSVPLEAVTEEQGHHYVFVEEHPDVFRRRPVELGASDGKRVEIRKGIASGDKVAVSGVSGIRLAESSGKTPPGHSHSH